MLLPILGMLVIVLNGAVDGRVVNTGAFEVAHGGPPIYDPELDLFTHEQKLDPLLANSSHAVSVRAFPNPEAPEYVPYDWNRGPRFDKFPTDPHGTKRLQQAEAAWLEALQLLNAAKWALCKDSEAIRRYFGWADFHTVEGVVDALHGPDNLGALAVADPNKPLMVLYVDPVVNANEPDDPCQNDPTLTAVFDVVDEYNPPRPVLWMCLAAFTAFPRPLVSWDCDHAPEYMNDHYNTLGAVFLHELTHWDSIWREAGVSPIEDLWLLEGWRQGS